MFTKENAIAVRAFVYTSGDRDNLFAGRTIRSLNAPGVKAQFIGAVSALQLQSILADGGPVLFLKSGCWLVRPELFECPVSSATGRGLCAFGVAESPPFLPSESGAPAKDQVATWSRTSAPALYLDEIAVRHVAERCPVSLNEIQEIARSQLRTVHYPLLDVYEDSKVRVLQVITALQRGGAERLTLELVSRLPMLNMRTRLVTMSRPSREAFAAPEQTIDLSKERDRFKALARAAIRWGGDLVHVHLLSGAEMRSIGKAGLPLMATIHNAREGWPAELEQIVSNDAVLLAGCAQAVERQLIDSKFPVAARTVWNGINQEEFRWSSERLQARNELRSKWNFGPDDFVLVAVANPRPQKRLHLLIPILAALRSRPGLNREVRLVLAGEASPGNSSAQQCISDMRDEFRRLALAPHVKWLGPVSDVPSLLAACDVLVSTSAHEGLSLAQMEALNMGCDVVATDVGGTSELAADNPRLHLLPVEATAEHFANNLADIACHQFSRSAALSSNWSSSEMCKRYAWLYPRAISAGRREKGEGLWLVTNNFSTGGAQSSARRLLLGLASQGIKVRAGVIEEEPNHPTLGRRALMDAGISVHAFEGARPGSELNAIDALLSAMDRDKPQSVLFWNLRPDFKVRIADALLAVPVFDVSPGEMYFTSLAVYFSKPHAGLPYRTARDYGARLAGVIVKYAAEAGRAAETLGATVHVVPNGVPLTDTSPRCSSGQTPLLLGTAARINPQKRIEDLFEALRVANGRLPSWTLKIAGGVERGCENYARQLRDQANGLPVEWLGEVVDVAGFHRDLDLFLMVSEPAGCPNASLEAMASGLPIIATDAGGASEQVLCGRTGRLVAPRDASAFAGALIELANQPALRQTMGTRARNLVEERFSVERMVADYRRICLPEI